MEQLLSFWLEIKGYLVALGVGIILMIVLGVLMGNVTVIRICRLCGLDIVSGNMVKDFFLERSKKGTGGRELVGWLSIPETCYSPVYVRGSVKTDLVALSKIGGMDLRGLSKIGEEVLGDLTIIVGPVLRNPKGIDSSKFTYLRSYIESDLRKLYPFVNLYDGHKIRKYEFLFAVEFLVGERQKIRGATRDEFISDIRSYAYMDTNKRVGDNVLILSITTDIDNLFIFLSERGEREDVQARGKKKKAR